MFKIFYNDLKSSILSLTLIGTLTAFITNIYLETLKYFFFHYYELIVCYIIIISLLTSACIYYFGPVTNSRLINITKWSAQLLGLLMVFSSARTYSGSFTLVLLTLAFCFFDFQTGSFSTVVYRPIKKISMDDYEEQSRVETKRAIEKLRRNLKSDSLFAAEILDRTQNKQSLKDFIEGGDHISLNEAISYREEYPDTIAGIVNKMDEEDDLS
ncbi:hypothetical protein HZS_2764, partial [Henneguya salminicola]